MRKRPLHSVLLWAFLLLCLAASTLGCGSVTTPDLPQTAVLPLKGEDLAGPCTYALRLTPGPVTVKGQPPSQIPQTGVLVVFERGDSLHLFDDNDVIAMAQGLHMAMMFAYQCNAASFGDLQPFATAGPGRALFQALNQFAISLNHPELATANVFLTGFSAAGFLSIGVANQFPDRVLGTIPYAPASSQATVNTADISRAVGVPSLILVSATDIAAGDQLPLFLFQRAWAAGAHWGFGSQHAYNHCCVDTIAPLLIPWVTAIFKNYTVANGQGQVSLVPPTAPAAPVVAFGIIGDGSFDPSGWQDFYFGSYSILPSTAGGPYRAWLPDETTTQAWVQWITAPN